MASITFDTELMVNHIAATPAAAGSVFTTVLEPITRRPAVISLSNESPPVLELIKEDDAGNRNLVDLGGKLNLPSGAVIQAFVAEQDETLKIYLAVAVKNDKSSDVYVCKPFLLDNLDGISLYPKQTMPTVNKLFTGAVTNPGSFPLLVADIQPPARQSSKSSDLKAIWVDGDTTQMLQTFELPQNADRIISVAVASYGILGKGLWVLYSTQNQAKLVCNLARPGTDGTALHFQRLEPSCDPRATAIASYTDKNQQSGLLVGTPKGLYTISAQDCINSTDLHTLIAEDSFFKAPARISVAQDGPSLTVWGLSRDGQLGYLTTDSANIERAHQSGAVLLGKQSSASFSASISQRSPGAKLNVITQTVISNDSQGNLTLLAQSQDTGIWRSEPFGIAHYTKTIEVQSYAVRVSIKDEKNLPISNGEVCVVASSDTTAYVNGRTYNITSDLEGTWLPLDSAGLLSMIMATNMISGRSFRVVQITDNQKNDVEMADRTVRIDPSLKVVRNLCSKLGSDADLSSLKTQSGQSLWSDGNRPGQEDLKAAHECFKKLNQAHSEVLNPRSSRRVDGGAVLKDIGDWTMDAFHHVKVALDDAVAWVIEQVEGVWRFVCKIAGEMKRFVLDTIEKIGEAAQWVWEKIKLGWDKLLDFLGHLFGWDDIKNTSDDIYNLLLGSVDWISDGIHKVEPKVEGFFDNLKGIIKVPTLTQPASTNQSQSGKSSSSAKASDSPAFNYLTDRMKNGNPCAAAAASSPSTSKPSGAGEPSFEEILKPLGESLMKLVTDLARDVSELFHGMGDLSPSQLFAKLGNDLLVNVIDVVKSIVVGVLKFLRKSIGVFKDLVTGKINVPIISALYKLCTGNDLNWLKLVAFILGFMTCTMSRIVTGKPPPRLQDPGQKFLDKMVDGGASEVEQKGNALFFSGVGMSISAVKIVYDAIAVAKSVSKVGAAQTAVTSVKTEAFGVAMDIATIVCIFPTDPQAPGYEMRKWITYINAASVGMDLALMLGSQGPNPAAEKGVAIFKFATDLVSACLYGIVFSKELDAEKKSWPDKDDDLTNCAICEDVFGAVKSCGKLICAVSAESPQSAAVGLAVMAAAGLGLTVNKGFTLNRTAEVNPKCYRGALC
ncbi:hypothetical protein FOPE_04183 [Fonsecaea pedrosoi]|nr:hypothetical protein FOPE_04183 [Fonsecaea pedrosoi]